MGIEGLLGILKPVATHKHISSFSGKTAAVDASGWLYKGAYACAWELGKGLQTSAYLNYPLKMITLLLRNNIKPIMVFDGLTIPLKEQTVAKRRAEKEKNKELGDKLMAEGKKEEAAKMYAKGICIQNSMMEKIFDILENLHVQYVVSPYEADAEIAYLCNEGIADIAITEDSDLLVYGCKSILFKLDIEGNCEHFEIESGLRKRSNWASIKDPCIKDIAGLTTEKFMELCILSGCDYLENIHGFGIKKALNYIKDYTLEQTLGKIQYQRQFMGKIPADYSKKVNLIKIQFAHGLIIEIKNYTIRPLTPLQENLASEAYSWIGAPFESSIVKDYAHGVYNIKKKELRQRITSKEAEKIIADMTTECRGKFYIEQKVKSGKKPSLGSEKKTDKSQKEANSIVDNNGKLKDMKLDLKDDYCKATVDNSKKSDIAEEVKIDSTHTANKEKDMFDEHKDKIEESKSEPKGVNPKVIEEIDSLFEAICKQNAQTTVATGPKPTIEIPAIAVVKENIFSKEPTIIKPKRSFTEMAQKNTLESYFTQIPKQHKQETMLN